MNEPDAKLPPAVPTNNQNAAAVNQVGIHMDVGQTLKAAWCIVKQTWINLSAWTVLWYIVGSVMFVIGLVLVLGVGWWQLGNESFTSLSALLARWPTLLTIGGFGLFGLLLLVSILSYLTSSGYLLFIQAQGQPAPLGMVMRRSLQLVLPLLLTGLLVTFLVVGGLGLFIIPGLIISIVIMFWMFEIVLNQTSYMTAIANSVKIVQQNFSFLFERWLVMVGLGMAWGFGVTIISMIFAVIPVIGPLLQILLQLAGYVFGWYVLAFWYLVYIQARETTQMEKKTNTSWIWIVALLGWVMWLVVGYGLYVGVKTLGPTVIEAIQTEIERSQENSQDSLFWDESAIPSEWDGIMDDNSWEVISSSSANVQVNGMR